MGPPSLFLVPDSSAEALIFQHRSSSSVSSSIASPSTDSGMEPASLPASSPSQHIRDSQVDISLPSSSSTLSNLVPEISPMPQSKGLPQYKQKSKRQRVQRKDNIQDEKSDPARQERSKQAVPRRDSADFQKRRKGCHDNVCCQCTAALAADCAAVCCCPLALLHLAALTFVRLPTAVAWKIVVNLKNKIYKKKRSAKASEEDSPRPNFAFSWSNGSSPEGRDDPRLNMVRFDSENLWRQFEAGGFDLGGLSMRRELI